MRLGQLSRKSGVRSEDIVEYLKSEGVDVKSGSNAKVEDDLLPQIYAHFNLEQEEEIKEELVKEENNEKNTSLIDEENNETAADEIAALYDHSEDQEQYSEEELQRINERIKTKKEDVDEIEPPDLIKAPKMELPGLKVVGKIDLPEPKPKEEKSEESPETETQNKPEDPNAITEITERDLRSERRQGRNRPKHNNRQKRKPKINPVELERRKAQKEAERQKKIKQEAEKKRKKQFYESNVRKGPTHQKSTAPKPDVTTVEPANGAKVKKSGNFLVRFWRWLDAKDPTASE